MESGSSRSVPSSATTSASLNSPGTSSVLASTDITNLEKDIAKLKKEKELYSSEKKILMEMLGNQCEELDAAEATNYELEK